LQKSGGAEELIGNAPISLVSDHQAESIRYWIMSDSLWQARISKTSRAKLASSCEILIVVLTNPKIDSTKLKKTVRCPKRETSP